MCMDNYFQTTLNLEDPVKGPVEGPVGGPVKLQKYAITSKSQDVYEKRLSGHEQDIDTINDMKVVLFNCLYCNLLNINKGNVLE